MRKKLIHVVQGETARANIKRDDIGMVTVGLKGCCAIVFSDAQGNASLTHADGITDTAFIDREVAEMQEKYSVDIICNPEYSQAVANKFLRYLNNKYPGIKNSSNKNEIRLSQQGTLLVCFQPLQNKITFLKPEKPHVAMLSPMNAKRRSLVGLPPANPLKNYELEEGDVWANIRMFERSLEFYYVKKTGMPTVVYDKGAWIKPFPRNKEIIDFIAEASKRKTRLSLIAFFKEKIPNIDDNLIPELIDAFILYKRFSDCPLQLSEVNRDRPVHTAMQYQHTNFNTTLFVWGVVITGLIYLAFFTDSWEELFGNTFPHDQPNQEPSSTMRLRM